jgi:hypothetical protein
VKTSSCKVLVYPCWILIKFEFSQHIFEKSSNISLIKISPVGAELFHVDGQTYMDMTKLIVAFRDFASTPKN